MSPRIRRLLAQVGSFVLAGILLYLALRGVDLGDVLRALREANYSWLAPLVLIVVASHLLRAARWRALIEALPELERRRDARLPSLRAAFYSVMIGYMVNYAAPRLGEVARTANLSARSRISFSSLFGTVVVERILDVIVLLAAIVSVFILLLDQFTTIDRLFIAPIAERLGAVPAMLIVLIAVGVGVLVLLLYRQILRSQDSALVGFWNRRAVPVLTSFKDGIATLLRSRRRAMLITSTLGMWFMYLVMAYLPFVMLGMHDAFGISLVDTWCIMILGAIGIAIPSPGGTGSYHYITIQALVHLFAVPQDAAATYAVLTHAAQLVLYVIIGAASLVLQGTNVRELREGTIAVREENPT